MGQPARAPEAASVGAVATVISDVISVSRCTLLEVRKSWRVCAALPHGVPPSGIFGNKGLWICSLSPAPVFKSTSYHLQVAVDTGYQDSGSLPSLFGVLRRLHKPSLWLGQPAGSPEFVTSSVKASKWPSCLFPVELVSL